MTVLEPKICEYCGRQFFRQRNTLFAPARYCPPCARLLVNGAQADVDFDELDRQRGLPLNKPRGRSAKSPRTP